jgi:hypothetical protein
MKTKRITAGACIALSLALMIAALFGINATDVTPTYGSVTPVNGQISPVFGNTQLVLSQTGTGTTTLNLSGTASTSIPCAGMRLSLATTGATGLLMGSGSATCTVPLYPTSTSGTAGSQFVDLPQVTNVNQLWFSLSNSTTGTYTANVNVIYAQ